MTETELMRRRERATREVLVIARSGEGYQVHTPGSPQRIYEVRPAAGRLACTCPDFVKHAEDPEWHCKHTLAVDLRATGRGNLQTEGSDSREPFSRDSGEGQPLAGVVAASKQGASMYLKRSVSPDGRIDSLSVGFTWPVDGISGEEIKARVEKSLQLQETVVERFRTHRKPSSAEGPRRGDGSSPATPARMVAIGGMDGKWGRRLFLVIEQDGRHLRLFGTPKQLAQAIAGAGFPAAAEDIAEGVELDLPCRVLTKPSADGRYRNVERVLPADTRVRR